MMAANRLFIFLHGVGDSAAGMRGFANHFAAQFPEVAIEVPDGTLPMGPHGGRQWFPIQGVTEENRPSRVAEGLPAVVSLIEAAQAKHQVAAKETVLIGFSQGTIMSLATVVAHPELVGTVIGFSGRFAELPSSISTETKIHLLHGEADPVMPVMLAKQAYAQLQSLGTSVTLDTEPGVAHHIGAGLFQKAIGYLTV